MVKTVFQVLVQPGTYAVQVAASRGKEGEKEEGEEEGGEQSETRAPQIQLEWHAKERTYIVHSLWISMTDANWTGPQRARV